MKLLDSRFHGNDNSLVFRQAQCPFPSLVVLSSGVTFSGIYFIWRHQTSLEEYRVEKEKIRKELFGEEKYKVGDKDFAIIFTIIILAVWLLELYLILSQF